MPIPANRLPLPGNEYFCFQIDSKSAHSAQHSRSRVLTKVIDTILDIISFEHQCVIIQRLLHSERLKQHMAVIGLDQLLSNSVLYENRCL